MFYHWYVSLKIFGSNKFYSFTFLYSVFTSFTLEECSSYRDALAKGWSLDDFKEVVKNLEKHFAPYISGEKTWSPPSDNHYTAKLPLPPWRCQPYVNTIARLLTLRQFTNWKLFLQVRMPPEEHIKKMEMLSSEQKRKLETNSEDQAEIAAGEAGMSKSQRKKLAKLAKKPKKQRMERNSEVCPGCPNFPVSMSIISRTKKERFAITQLFILFFNQPGNQVQAQALSGLLPEKVRNGGSFLRRPPHQETNQVGGAAGACSGGGLTHSRAQFLGDKRQSKSGKRHPLHPKSRTESL